MRQLVCATDLSPADIAFVTFIANQEIALAETEVNASLYREFLEFFLYRQNLAIVQRE